MNENDTRTTSRTNWAKVDALTDQEIDTLEVPALSDAFFARAQGRMPQSSEPVLISVHVDPEVLAWFEAQGNGYQQRMRAALRIYAEAHKEVV